MTSPNAAGDRPSRGAPKRKAGAPKDPRASAPSCAAGYSAATGSGAGTTETCTRPSAFRSNFTTPSTFAWSE